MEFTINRGNEEDVPKVHRQSGAVVNQVAESLKPFVSGSAFGEWFYVDVDNCAVFLRGLRIAASESGVGVHPRIELNNPTLTKQNRKEEDVVDNDQPGRVWFAFDKKREGVGRKKAQPAVTVTQVAPTAPPAKRTGRR